MQILTLNKNYYKDVVELIRSTHDNFSWSDNQILKSLEKDLVFGLFIDNNLCGMSIFNCIFDTAELLYICIAPPSQNKGFACKLLENSFNFIAKNDIKEIFLEVDVKNDKAIHLYKKLGFKNISRRKNYYKNKDGSTSDALIYQLNISK